MAFCNYQLLRFVEHARPGVGLTLVPSSLAIVATGGLKSRLLSIRAVASQCMDSEDKKISACPNLSSGIIEYSPCALLVNVLATWGLVKDGNHELNRPPLRRQD